jgi:hypothetical protein
MDVLQPLTTGTEPDTEVLVPNVSPDDFARLVTMVRDDGGVVSGDSEGVVENPCFTARFHYDKDSRVLTLEPFRLMPGLRPRRLRKTVEQMIAPPAEPVRLESGQTIYKPTPHSCATYNWVIGFFTNNSGGILTYSGSDTSHGNLQDVTNKIQPGDTPDTHQNGFWTNQSPKDSGLGCFGSISYQLADGLTTLTVTYGLNTLSTESATVALSGQNASRYTATCDKYDTFYYAAAYLYPYVTLSKA